jgi:hypothetical protein
MARWNPPSSVGPNEQIGHRLFEEPMLRGAGGQPNFSGLRFNHFEESRGNEVSLDRLGASSIDRKVSNYLVSRARAAGETFGKPKKFDGWAVVPAKELIQAKKDPKLPICASPVVDAEPKDNAYHAHVVRPDHFDSYMMALHLRHLFTSYGKVHSVNAPEEGWSEYLSKLPMIGPIVTRLVRAFGKK